MSDLAEKKAQDLVHVTIDGKSIAVPKGSTVYQACKQLGIDIPIFCYLDRLPPFGACRMCLVEVEKMGKPQTSCTLEVAEGMVVKTQSAMAVEERKGILELLLINHPLDCPICDRAGECPLQENVIRYGPGLSRFFEEKRKFVKPIPLSSVLMLDRERCIACARCVRFCDHLSGDRALEFIDRGFKTEVGTAGGRAEASKFIGNTIFICPVGALTSQTYRFKGRPWDNQVTKSTCTLCPIGCSQFVDTRDGKVARTRSCENKEVNDIWLCDKGWFGYTYSSSEKRLKTPLIKRDGAFVEASWDEALSVVATEMDRVKNKGKVAAFGGNPLTFEENFLFQKLFREGLNSPHIDHRIGEPQLKVEEEGLFPHMSISFSEASELDFALLLGLDITEQFPLLWLRLREAIHKGAEVSFAGHVLPEVAGLLQRVIKHSPGKEMETLESELLWIQEKVLAGKKGALFIGDHYLRTNERAQLLQRCEVFQKNVGGVSLNVLEGRNNSVGARIAGVHPQLAPFGKKAKKEGLSAHEVVEDAAKNGWDFLYVVGSNPRLKFPSSLWNAACEKLSFLVVQDLFMTETAKSANVVLPVLSAFEKNGSFINIEGRIQEITAGNCIEENLYSDEEIFLELGRRLDCPMGFDKECTDYLEPSILKWSKTESSLGSSLQKGCTEKLLEGELFASFSRLLFDKGVRMRHNKELLSQVKEPRLRLSLQTGQKFKLQDGEWILVTNGVGKLKGKVQIDPLVADNTLVIPIGFEEELPVFDLGCQLINGMRVQIEKCNT